MNASVALDWARFNPQPLATLREIDTEAPKRGKPISDSEIRGWA